MKIEIVGIDVYKYVESSPKKVIYTENVCSNFERNDSHLELKPSF